MLLAEIGSAEHCIKIDLVKGNGLYLTHHSSGDGVRMGDGLYLKRGNSISGEGLILGKKYGADFNDCDVLFYLFELFLLKQITKPFFIRVALELCRTDYWWTQHYFPSMA